MQEPQDLPGRFGPSDQSVGSPAGTHIVRSGRRRRLGGSGDTDMSHASRTMWTLCLPQIGLMSSSGDRSNSDELINPICGEHNVHIVRDACDISVSPNRPAAADDRFGRCEFQQAIQRFDHSTKPARQVLRFLHAVSSLLQFFCKRQHFREID